MPRLHGFEARLANGQSSGEIKSKYNCNAITFDARAYSISKVSFKVDRMMNSFQCYTGVRFYAKDNESAGGERLVFEQDFDLRGHWLTTSIPEGEKFIGFYGQMYDQLYVTELGCLTVKNGRGT